MQGIYYTRGGATVAAPGFPKEGGGQANSLFLGGGGGDLVYMYQSLYYAKNNGF